MKFQVRSMLNDLDTKLKPLLDQLKPGDIVLISGPVGAGKTTFVRHFVSSKSVEVANSPSYNLIQEYLLKDFKVIHIDLYRIKDESDLESIGFWDCLAQTNYIGFIEWPEMLNIDDLKATRILKLKLEIAPENPEERIYTLILKN